MTLGLSGSSKNCIRGWGKSASRFYRRLCLGLTADGSLDWDRDVLGHGGFWGEEALSSPPGKGRKSTA